MADKISENIEALDMFILLGMNKYGWLWNAFPEIT